MLPILVFPGRTRMDSVDLVEFGLQQRSRSRGSRGRIARLRRLRCPGCSCSCRQPETRGQFYVKCIVQHLYIWLLPDCSVVILQSAMSRQPDWNLQYHLIGSCSVTNCILKSLPVVSINVQIVQSVNLLCSTSILSENQLATERTWVFMSSTLLGSWVLASSSGISLVAVQQFSVQTANTGISIFAKN